MLKGLHGLSSGQSHFLIYGVKTTHGPYLLDLYLMFFYVLLHAHILEEIALNDGRFIYQFEGKFYEAFTAS
jgi:hypothetical protein